MPHFPKIKVKMHDLPLMPHLPLDDLPEEIQREVKEKSCKGEYVQFRMPLDVWARLRGRQSEMQKTADQQFNTNGFEIPMTEVLRATMKKPVYVRDDEIAGMVRKGRKGGKFFL